MSKRRLRQQAVPSSVPLITGQCVRVAASKTENRSDFRQASSRISWRSCASCKLDALTNILTSQLALLVTRAVAAALIASALRG
jgi:hypothetical protein